MTNTLQCIVNYFGALIIVIFAFEEELFNNYPAKSRGMSPDT